MYYRSGIRNLGSTKNKMFYKKKIFFILPSLGAGGAERVLSYIAQQLNNQQFNVKLIILGFEKDAVYNVNSVDVLYLNKVRLIDSLGTLFKLLTTEKPDIVVSSIGHVNVAMGFFSLLFKKIKFVGREASVVSVMKKYSNTNSNVVTLLMRFIYPKLSAVVCQSDDMKKDLINVFGLNSKKLFLIHNPITNTRIISNRSINKNNVQFVTVGRLSEEKGYLRILSGLSKIQNYNFHYTIIGSGPYEEQIKKKATQLRLDDKVTFISFSSNVFEEYSKSDYFLQGSYVEGFPNGLLESCTVGTPVIAFNVPGGTKEIVIDGVNGFLVESETHFNAVLNNFNQLETINRNNVLLSVVDKFNSRYITEQYSDLFNSI